MPDNIDPTTPAVETAEGTDDLDAPLGLLGWELVGASFVVLFQELALIRWLPAQVRVTAYFPNLILISAFLGLGLGALRGRRRSMSWLWPVSLAVLVVVAVILGRVAFTSEGVTEHLWLMYSDLGEDALVIDGVRLPIVLLFVLSAVSFVPLGQFVASRLDVFRARSSALWGYVLDLSGSLAGVVAFSAASFLGSRPVVWFAVVTVAGTITVGRRRRAWALCAGAAVLILAAVHLSDHAEYYSPYYALTAESEEGIPDYRITANGSVHQFASDLEMASPALTARRSELRRGYHMPYELLDRPIGKALVLGAGTGNDVAVLLDEGATEIHAVEIDPTIIEIGRALHPNRPYDDGRVTLFNTDARSFLNDSDELYDLVVFGTLDSMTRLSALSNVRLDNFVYTEEAVAAARSHLAPGGGMIMYFMVGEPYIHEHLTAILTKTFGTLPTVIRDDFQMFNTIFVAGAAFDHLREVNPELDRLYLEELLPNQDVPTDDWPYLYLPEKGLTPFYLSMMAIFVVLAVVSVLASSSEMRVGVFGGGGIDVEMFLFGLAFLLIESKFVTAMNLVWGATWLTSAVVFGAILATILVGTILTEVRPLSWRVASIGLIAALLGTYLVPTEVLVGRATPVRLAVSVLFVGAPVFFASACFALRFKVREAADVAFGWNLLGAVVGGLLEFFSMSVGLKAMTLVAIMAYLGSFLAYERTKQGTEGPTTGASEAPLPVG